MKSLFNRPNSYVALLPANMVIDAVLADIEAVWQIPKTRLAGQALLSGTSQFFRREHSDELHVFVPVIKFVNMLEQKNRLHKNR